MVKWYKRAIFGIVGLAGVYALLMIFVEWSRFWHTMSWYSALGYILVMIGALNWLWVAFSGKLEKDLLAALKIK